MERDATQTAIMMTKMINCAAMADPPGRSIAAIRLRNGTTGEPALPPSIAFWGPLFCKALHSSVNSFAFGPSWLRARLRGGNIPPQEDIMMLPSPMTGRGAVRCGLAMMLLWLAGAAAEAACTAVAGLPLPYTPAAVGAGMVPPGHVGIRFLGHASFLIASPGGVSIVTDYNAYTRPDDLPDIVTMNHAHSSHYIELPDPGIKLVLRGWNTGNGVADYDITFGDVRVRNVPTNIRDDGALRGDGGTEYGGNSIFVFDVAELCIAHLGHLHHTLTPQHLAQLGPIDVLFAPVDGTWTLGHDDLIEVIEQIRPALVIPMHYFSGRILETFLAKTAERYRVRRNDGSSVVLAREELPKRTEILVVPAVSPY
jgi:L-ascorbate metabolism protein UlaG (beta-lactamase superfamily)